MNKMETKKKVKLKVVSVLAVLALIAGIIVGMNRPEPLQLENLVEGVKYEVLEVAQDDQTQVDIQMNAEENEVIKVVQAIVAEIQSNKHYEEGEGIRVEVFNEKPATLTDESATKPTLEDETHDYTAVYEETLKLYRLVNMEDVQGNILATNDWLIEGSRYQDGHLVGQVVLTEEKDETVIYAQLKAIESEMKRFNKVAENKHTYFTTPQVDKLSYGYSSVYPKHLIVEKEITISKTK